MRRESIWPKLKLCFIASVCLFVARLCISLTPALGKIGETRRIVVLNELGSYPTHYPRFAIESRLFRSYVRGSDNPRVRRILIINEAGTEWPGIRLVDQGIRAALDKAPYELEFYREYMDTLLFPDRADQQRFREFYIRKYRDRRPNVIITVGPSPLKFMAETHTTAFPDVPIVFCYPNWVPSSPALDSDFTGVENDLAAFDTVETALRLRPGTKHIIVVGGTSFNDTQFLGVAKAQLKPFESNYEVTYFTSLSMPDLLIQLKNIPKQSIVLITSLTRDAAGSSFTAARSSAMVVEAANAPVFTLVDANFGHGEVGGKLSSLSEQGRIAGELALRILKGEKPQDVPRVKAGAIYTFDWRALKRWGIEAADLPPGSIILNRPLSPWEAYRWYIAGGISLIVLETVLISALLWQRWQRKKTESELAGAYDRLRLSLETGRSVVWDWDVKSGKDRWYGDLKTVFGIHSDTYSGRVEEFHRRVHPDDLQSVLKAVAEAGRSKTPYVAEFRVIRDDDESVRWISARGNFYYAKNGDVQRMLGTAVDITERKRAEQDVQESEERFRLVANTAPVMIWMSGPDSACTYLNSTWLEFTGRSLNAELGMGWAQRVHPDDLPRGSEIYLKAYRQREPYRMEYRLLRHDGEYRWILVHGMPRFNADGSFAGFIGSAIDVTERKAAEEAMANIGRRLIEAHEEERKWIARELHDGICQALALVACELDSTIGESGSDGTRDTMRHALQRLGETAKDVQELSHRLHSSKLEYLGIAVAAKSFCRDLSRQKNVRVDFVEEGVPRTLPEEISVCLFRVLQESLQNAVKYSGVQQFKVEMHGTSEQILLTVSDSGRGFDEHEAMSRDGLGLISMRERTQLVGGGFSIQSEIGKGTTVSARIPLAASRAATG